jgi:hypothetical protein
MSVISIINPRALGVAAAAFTPPGIGAEQALQQAPLTLKADKVLPKGMLSGDGYSINQDVSNDGFQNTYTLTTDYGNYTVTGCLACHAFREIHRGLPH